MKTIKKERRRKTASINEKSTLARAYRAGAIAAADHASSYDSSSTHDYLLGDCILGKMNLRKGKPRKNHRRLSMDESFVRGFALGLSDMLMEKNIIYVFRNAGVTLRLLRRYGLMPNDLRRLKEAGVQ